MEREPGKMTSILKYDNMESDTKAKKGSNDVQKHAGYGMTHVTPKVTLDKNFILIWMLIIPLPGMMMTQPQTLPVTLPFWK